MTVLTQESFGTGTIGQPVLASNTIFSNITGGCTYVAGLETADAGKACRLGVAGTGGVRETGFSMSKAVFRFIIDTQTLPAANAEMANCHYFDGAANVKAAAIRITPAGKLSILNIATAVATSTTDVSTGVFAVEWEVDLASDTQELRIFNTVAANATPVEVLTGAATSPGTNLIQFQAGRYTSSALLWDIDGYKRADDWIVTPIAHVWDIHFDGTIGNAVVVGLPIVTVDSPAPVYAAGGVAASQIRARVAPTTSATGVKASFTSNPATSWERFYYEPESVLSSESYQIWRAENDAAVASAKLLLSNPTAAATLTLILVDGNDLNVASGGVMQQQQPFRVESNLVDNGAGGTNIEFRIFHGTNLHGLTPNFTLVADSPFTGRKNRWLRKGATPAARGAFFDEWVGSTDTWIGPVPDATPQPLPAQWRFWEHHAATPDAPTLLTPSLWTGGAEVPIDIGATTIKGEGVAGAEAFAGDPGAGKIRLGWGVDGTYSDHATEAARMKTVVVPGDSTGNADRDPTFYRVFNNDGNLDTIGTHQATLNSNSETRRAMIDGQMVLLTQSHYATNAGGNPKMTSLQAGTQDAFWNTMVGRFKDCATRYNGKIALNLGNELDDDGKQYFNHAADLLAIREGHRYIFHFLKDAGVTNVAMTTMTYIQQAFNDSGNRGARVETEGASLGNRWDAWWHYHPDWKGTRSAQWNRAAVIADPNAAWNPDPNDFYQVGENNGFGLGPTVDVQSCNAYCTHGMNGFAYRPDLDEWLDWSSAPTGPFTDNTYEAHTFTNRNGASGIAQHAWRMTQAYRNLYGRGNYAVLIGEFGFPVWEQETQAFPTATANWWKGDLAQSLLDSDVRGVAIWKLVGTRTLADVHSSAQAFGGRYWNITATPGYPGTQWKGQPDSTDARAKGVAGFMDRSEVAPKIVVP